jgi:predicted esterase
MELTDMSQTEFLSYVDGTSIKNRVALLQNIEDFIEEEGPFDGLFGFSEGAAVAATFIIHQSRRLNQPEDRIKCAVFFCGGIPEDPDCLARGMIRSLDPEQDGEIIDIPTAHIWAENDISYPNNGRKLFGLCRKDARESYVHQLGHSIPGSTSNKGLSETVRVIQRVFEYARND